MKTTACYTLASSGTSVHVSVYHNELWGYTRFIVWEEIHILMDMPSEHGI